MIAKIWDCTSIFLSVRASAISTLTDKELSESYLDALLREIRTVGCQYPEKKRVTSLYFGGGTPALVADRLKAIIDACKEHFVITEGIGLELHPDNVNIETLQILKGAGVTKISIGIQSFQKKYQHILGRKAVDPAALSTALDAVPFETVSMDFTFTKSPVKAMEKKEKRALIPVE